MATDPNAVARKILKGGWRLIPIPSAFCVLAGLTCLAFSIVEPKDDLATGPRMLLGVGGIMVALVGSNLLEAPSEEVGPDPGW